MAWDGPNPGVHVRSAIGSERSPLCTPMQLTSVSHAWITVGGSFLRMYGVDTRVVDVALAYAATSPRYCVAENAADYDPLAASAACSMSHVLRDTNREDEFIQYIDAHPPRGVGAPQFWILPTSDRGASPLHPTCVPQGKEFQRFSHRKLDYSTGSTAVYASDRVVAKYGGVKVVELPSGKWLMLLHRRYAALFDPNAQPDLITASGYLENHCVNSDIVGYVSDGPSFTDAQNTVGPFWMVDALDALPADELPGLTPKPRMFLGVPGAVVDDGYLYIYYTVAANYFFEDGDGRPAEAWENYPGCEDTSGGDATAGRAALTTALDSGTVFYGGPFRPGIGCKRIDLEEFRRWRGGLAQGILTHEPLWELLHALGSDVLCPGESLGRVRVWTPGPDRSHRLLELVLPDSGAIIDPEPVLCADRSLSLVFPATGCSAGQQGCGLWRAAGFDDGAHLHDDAATAPGWVTTTRGKDFLLRFPAGSMPNDSPDLIVGFAGDPTATGGVQYLNPSVALVGSRVYHVYTGGSRFGMFSGDYSTFSYFTGNLSDMCGF